MSIKRYFYQEQWVYAKYIDEDDGAVVYFVQCPAALSPEEKNRARNHFNGLDLANRFSLEAGKHLSEVIDQKECLCRCNIGFDPPSNTTGNQKWFCEMLTFNLS